MNSSYIFKTLYENISVFNTLLQNVENQQAIWKPAENKWSILEVINHLYDEERSDFRLRLDLTLHHPGESWPPIDPESWAMERDYNLRDFKESLANWIAERKKSVNWLHSLSEPDFSKVYIHPLIGELRAGDMLAAWLAHDFLHMRQIVNLKLDYTITIDILENTVYQNKEIIFTSKKTIIDTYEDQLRFFIHEVVAKGNKFNTANEAYEILKICLQND